jgi:hypothetical protein
MTANPTCKHCGGNHLQEEELYDKDADKLCERLESIRKFHQIDVIASNFAPQHGEPNYAKIRYLDMEVPA